MQSWMTDRTRVIGDVRVKSANPEMLSDVYTNLVILEKLENLRPDAKLVFCWTKSLERNTVSKLLVQY